MKHFLSITDIKPKEIWELFAVAKKLKQQLKKTGTNEPLLKGKTLAMIFEKPSLRTRLSFEIGMTQLGGHAIYLAPADIGLGVRESIADVAKVTSSMADMIMARVFKHKTVCTLAEFSKVPVINDLSDWEHPCQILSDLFTIWEYKKKLSGVKLAFIGDGENNITHSLALASGMFGTNFICAAPSGYEMKSEVIGPAQSLAAKSGGSIDQVTDPIQAVTKADIVYTDTWVSIGDEKEKKKRLKDLRNYQVNQDLIQQAKSDAIFMHDLPAYRGNEVTDEVIDGPKSIVFQQAENRLHVQKALLLFLLGKTKDFKNKRSLV